MGVIVGALVVVGVNVGVLDGVGVFVGVGVTDGVNAVLVGVAVASALTMKLSKKT